MGEATPAKGVKLDAVPYTNLKLILQRIHTLERVHMQKSCKNLKRFVDTNLADQTLWARNMVIVFNVRKNTDAPSTLSITTYLHKEMVMNKRISFTELKNQIEHYRNFHFQKIVIVSDHNVDDQLLALKEAMLGVGWKVNCINHHYHGSTFKTTGLPRLPNMQGVELIAYENAADVAYSEENFRGRVVAHFGDVHSFYLHMHDPTCSLTPALGMGAEHISLHGPDRIPLGWKKVLPEDVSKCMPKPKL